MSPGRSRRRSTSRTAMIDNRPLQPAVFGDRCLVAYRRCCRRVGDAAVASATEPADADDASAGRNRRCRAPRRGRRRRHPGIRRLPGPRRAAPYSPAASLAASPPAPPPRTSRPTPPPPAPSARFTAAIDEPRATDGWFDGGVLTCETGDNARPGDRGDALAAGVGRAHAAAAPSHATVRAGPHTAVRRLS